MDIPWLIITLAIGGLSLVALAALLSGVRHARSVPNPESTPPVTIIVAAHNEAKHLALLLNDLTSQYYPGPWNILLVLDRCTDASKRIASHYPAVKVIEITEVPEGITPKKYALTQAIRAAQTDWLLFTDADCRMGPKWLTHMAAQMHEDASIVLGIGAYQRNKGLLNLWVRFETWWTATQYLGLAGQDFPYMGVGRNLAYRKSLWVKEKGFAKHASRASGDDDLFVNQAATPENVRTAQIPSSYTYSEAPANWGAWFRQKTRHFSAGPAYRGPARIILPLLNVLRPLFFLSLLILPFATGQWALAIGIVLLRWGLEGVLIAVWKPPLFEKNFLWTYPLMDILMTLHFLTVAPAGFILKPIWKAD